MIDFAPWARILLRVVSGWLIAKGGDPDLIETVVFDPAIIGAVTWGMTEAWYLYAKKSGGAT